MPTWSGYWKQQFNQAYTLYGKYPAPLEKVALDLRGSIGKRKVRATLLALTGAAPDTVSKALTQRRITNQSTPGSLNSNGGKRTIATVTLQSGNASSADLALYDTVIAKRPRVTTYPRAVGRVPVLGRPASFV